MVAYRIAWRIINTDVTGHGEYCLTKEMAEIWLEDLKNHTDMVHWIEEEGP